MDERPLSLFDLTKPVWRSQVAIANPLFGTTSINVAALFLVLGDEKAKKFLNDLKANRVKIVSSNSEVRRLVARGEVKVGITDTDDANVALGRKCSKLYIQVNQVWYPYHTKYGVSH